MTDTATETRSVQDYKFACNGVSGDCEHDVILLADNCHGAIIDGETYHLRRRDEAANIYELIPAGEIHVGALVPPPPPR